MLLDIIGATVIGGTSLAGGKGKVLDVLRRDLLRAPFNTLNTMGLSAFHIDVVKGGIILPPPCWTSPGPGSSREAPG